MMHEGLYIRTAGDLELCENIAACEGPEFIYVNLTKGITLRNPDAPVIMNRAASAHCPVGFVHTLGHSGMILDEISNFFLMARALGPSPLPVIIRADTSFEMRSYRVIAFARHIEAWTNATPNPRVILRTPEVSEPAASLYPWGRWTWTEPPAEDTPTTVLRGSELWALRFVGTDEEWGKFNGRD